MPECKWRSFWKMALKAFAAAAAVAALLVLCGFILATSQVRHSAFGRRMERRFPIRWSQVALVFGDEEARGEAVRVLPCTNSRRAIPTLVRATRDRSATVSDAAVGSLWDLAPHQEAERAIVSACRDRRTTVRAGAYDRMDPLYTQREITPAEQAALAGGLRDPDAICQWIALESAFGLYAKSEASPELLQALQNRLLSPPARSAGDPRGRWLFVEGEQCSTLVSLWLRDTPESRAQLREYLRKHPLTAPRPA